VSCISEGASPHVSDRYSEEDFDEPSISGSTKNLTVKDSQAAKAKKLPSVYVTWFAAG